jgi:uncharacterized protein
VHIIRLFRGFEWDEDKARDNLRKHGLDFADATAVLEDEWALTMRDETSGVDEERFLTLGAEALGRVIVVAYTWRGARIGCSRLDGPQPANDGSIRERDDEAHQGRVRLLQGPPGIGGACTPREDADHDQARQ